MAKKSKDSIIQPIIRAGDAPHVFETMEKEGELPTLKSVGFGRVTPTSREFVSYVITTKGHEVLSVEVSEPNLKAIAIDEAKVSFVQCFMNEDGL